MKLLPGLRMLNVNSVLASLITTACLVGYISADAHAAEVTAADEEASTASSAIVTWSRPVENTDGSPLTNLSGYVLYYGTGFPVPYSAIFIDASATSLEIQNLSPGNWYFQIESVNSEGVSSELSPTVFKTIQ